jgi:DNA polymerase-3 subunit chi
MPGSCKVDFYVLQNPGQSAEHLACRLALKAWEQGHRIAVMTEDPRRARELDALMWEHPPGRFLPHALIAEDADAPVQIGTFSDDFAGDRDLVINLTDRECPEPERYSRLLEIVPAGDAERAASRGKFMTYRGRGLALATHDIGESQ